MKKILSLIIFLFLCITPVYAYEYILPEEYKNIKIYDNFDIIVAQDKDMQTAIYDFSGKKISDDYDIIQDFGENQVTIATKDNKDLLINCQGTIVNEFEEKLLGVFNNNLVFVDMGNNNDGRPLNKYEGNFAVCNFQGNNSVLIPYKKFIHPQKSASIGFGFSGNRMIFFENEKCGAVDLDLNTVIPAEYDMLYPFTCDYTIAVKNGKYGIIDNMGNTTADFKYDYIEDIGIFKTKKDNCFGIISKHGKTIYDTVLEYEPVSFFSDYYMLKIKDNSYFGIIDFYNNTVLPAEYTSIDKIENGAISTDKGFYNLQGKLLPDYTPKQALPDEISVTKNGDNFGVIKQTKKKPQPLWNFEYIDFPDNNSFIEYNKTFEYNGTITSDNSYINASGDTIIPAGNHTITPIGNNVLKVQNNDSPHEIRIVKEDGTILADNCRYVTNVGDNGYIGISKDSFEGYINTNGDTVLVLDDYHVIGAFSEGLAAVLGKKSVIFSNYGEISYINEQGTLMLQDAEWCSGGEFKNGLITVGTNLGKSGPQDFKLVKCTYDTPSEWASSYINEAIEKELVPEHLKSQYANNITRENFCEIAFNLPIIKNALNSDITPELTFTDTNNEKILILSALGIIKGVGNNKFLPDSFITREEAATILHRICKLSDKQSYGETGTYSDDSLISDWARESVYRMQIAGIMNGVGNNRFAPKDGYTTEQTITTILRIYKMEE